MCDKFIASLKKLGVKNGDILYISSDFTLFLADLADTYGIENINYELNTLIDNLQELVGNNGTILFPIFSWEFNKAKTFDIKNTKGSTGAISNWILQNRKDFLRTKHPMYSFMVWGKDARSLANINNVDAFGQFSPFGYIHKNNAKMIFFDISVRQGITFVHYAEEILQVPYRYFKSFCSDYIDENGVKSKRSYVMYVRDLAIQSHEYLSDEFFESKGILSKTNFDKHSVKIISCKNAFNIMQDDFLNNFGKNMYIFDNYTIDWTKSSTHSDEI